ncbi:MULTISPECIES: DUF4185 domain-containing protein [Myxococcaceae]|uniref:DUF4185 domain-containing protein n=1 Tax=Myxococcaceae TaxID=31 RepID=UPI001E49B7BF|nr:MULTISPECIES: DUF4185 domain-containing protein [Myxococcaceae]
MSQPYRPEAQRLCTRSTVLCLLLGAALASAAASASAPGTSERDPRLSVAPDAPFVLRSVGGVQRIAGLTGVGSPNATERYGIEGTDLGSMFSFGGRTWFVFGDTFGKREKGSIGAGGAQWRSNTIAYTRDTDPTDGITFDGMLVDGRGRARQLVPSKKVDGDEMTVIPTHGFAAGDTMYLHWMSVRHWGKPGEWETNFAGLAKSTDEGRTWTVLDAPRWGGESSFVQVAPATVREDGADWLYFWGTTHGRFGGVSLMKVPASQVESPAAYRYFQGTDAKGAPRWSASQAQARRVVDDTTGELSVVWNAYLGHWLMSYLKEGTGIVMREGLAPWGPWGPAVKVLDAADAPGAYAPFMAEQYVRDGGRTVYFSLSAWGPYNVSWYKAELTRADGASASPEVVKREPTGPQPLAREVL